MKHKYYHQTEIIPIIKSLLKPNVTPDAILQLLEKTIESKKQDQVSDYEKENKKIERNNLISLINSISKNVDGDIIMKKYDGWRKDRDSLQIFYKALKITVSTQNNFREALNISLNEYHALHI